ncbi:MAG TPA: ABC transporter permease [Candidatus Saccharimonadales bacterium]|nr:ABC transporter permease [Candidatus Saccharimonadales bacterium]
MENLGKDLRYAVRMLLKNKGFAFVAILTLGLGIGASTAIFSVFNGMLWRHLPVKDADQLVVLAANPRNTDFFTPISYPDFLDYRKLDSAFADVAAFSPTPVNFGADGRPERVWAELVSGNFFSMLGVPAAPGRMFSADEGWVPGKDALVVLSHKYWLKRFAGDPAVVGRSVQVNQHPFTIIGVAPENFHGAYYFLEPDFYLPLSELATLDSTQLTALTNRGSAMFRVIGRLRPGVTATQAAAIAQPLDQRLSQEFPEVHKDVSLAVIPELAARPEPGFGGFMTTALSVFMALAGLVLLIASANVANLILARANGRRKELATRTAMGASRVRMVRQLLTESVLLSLCGGAAGLVLAYWVGLFLTSIRVSPDIPVRLFDVQMDWRIFVFGFVAAVLTGVIAGLVPAVQASKTNLADTLKAGGRSGGGAAGHSRFRNALVVTQVAVSVLLLACAGLFLRSLRNSAQVDMGFRVDHLLMLNVDLGLQGYQEDRGQRFYEQLRTRVSSLPGVRGAAASAYIPMGLGAALVDIKPDGQVVDGKTANEAAIQNSVQPGYFAALGVPLISGREFTEADSATAGNVAIVNDAFAKKIWPNQDPLGKTFRTTKDGQPIQVVGLTRTGKYLFLYEAPQMYVYFPLAQRYSSSATLMVHSEGDPASLTAAVREQISQLDSTLPVFDVQTMAAHVQYGKPLLPARIAAMLVGAFGLLGLALATVGVYGVVSYSVSQQTQEIGIRTALGAQRRNILGLVLKQGMTMSLLGTALGAAIASVVLRALHSILYGVRSTDIATLASVSGLLLLVAFTATCIPALRATRVDPVIALRGE